MLRVDSEQALIEVEGADEKDEKVLGNIVESGIPQDCQTVTARVSAFSVQCQHTLRDDRLLE